VIPTSEFIATSTKVEKITFSKPYVIPILKFIAISMEVEKI